MVDMGSIAAALGGLKTAGEIAKALLQMKSDAERQAKVIELQSVILAAQSSAISAQSDQFAMLEEVRKAKEELAKVKAWETEKQRYRLAQPFSGCMVYALQKSMSDGEPPHYICAACYQQGRRSILQGVEGRPRKEGGRLLGSYNCPVCKSEAYTGYVDAPAPRYFEDIKQR